MIRYVNSGERRYGRYPVRPYARGLIEFQAILKGEAHPFPSGHTTRQASSRPRLWAHAPYSVHGWTDGPDGKSEVVVFHVDEVRDSFAEVLSRRGSLEVPLHRQEAKHLMELAARTRKDFGNQLTLESRSWFDKVRAELCWLAIRGSKEPVREGPRPRAVWTVEDALRWYRERVLDNPSVADVAVAIGVSPAHLRRLFHEVQHRAPQESFRRIRLDMARAEVMNSSRTLAEISDEWGFSEPGAFSRAYRQLFGHTPRQDRKS